VLRSKFTFNETSADSGRQIKLVLPDGWSVQDSSSVNLNAYALDDSVDWIVNVPSSVPAGGDSFYTAVSGLDKNSGLSFAGASSKTGYTVVPRSSLVLNMKIVEPAGAVDDTLSTDQVFRLQGLVANVSQGAAASGRGNAHIHTGSKFSLSDSEGNLLPADSVRSFTVGEPVSWWIKVSAAAERMNLSSLALLSALADNQIEVELVDIPADVNSGLPAFVQNASEIKTFIVEEKAEILTVTALSQETLSTGQSFVFEIQAELNASVSNVQAVIVLPAVLGSSPAAAVPLNDDNEAQWILEIPEDYSGTGTEIITVNVTGTDQNSGLLVQLNSQKTIHIEHKAVLTMRSLNVEPFSVWNSGLASRGQKITISIKPGYAQKISALDYAAFTNSGSILLDSTIADQGFELDEGFSYEQNFSSFDDVLTWIVKAPQADLTTAFNLRFANMPLDENSQKTVTAGGDSASVTVPMRVRQKTIIVTLNEDIISDTTLTNPADNIPILGFNVSNEEYDDNLHIRGLKLQFVSTEGTAFSTQSLKSMLLSLSIVDVSEVQEALAKSNSLNSVHSYGDYSITDTTANPLVLDFNQEVQIAPHEEAGIAVLARFRDRVINRSFKTKLLGVNVYDFNPDTPLEIIDSTGADIAESELLNSKEFSLVSENPKDDFGNYPNPFGRQHERTNIAFRLTDDSDVNIRIFTLVGGLVWTKKLQGLSMGSHKTTWDGRNDKGHLVLNGVYLCSIEIRPVNGGSTKRYITKIAFIK